MLEGEIEVKGSKNAALAALASSLLFSAPGGSVFGGKKPPVFLNLPDIEDIKRMRELISSISANGRLNQEIAKRFRASILVVGPLLARFGKAAFPHPGGCVIGARPIDVFIDGWKEMGAKVKSEIRSTKSEILNYELIAKNGLRGIDYTFRTQSVTGTEGLMMTALLAKGGTTLRNCAMEPEIKYLAKFLNQNGADIRGAGMATIHISGRDGKLLDAAAVPFINPPDRIEAGTLAILGALAARELLIKNFPTGELGALISALKDADVEILPHQSNIMIRRAKNLRAVNIKTKEYPGFATDLQAPFCVLATQAAGQSLIHEAIFEGRLAYTEDLNRMGAHIVLERYGVDAARRGSRPRRAVVSGPTPLYGRDLESPDLRAGLAFVIAALIAEGESKIGNIYQIDRGYEKIDERLRAVGAEIVRVD